MAVTVVTMPSIAPGGVALDHQRRAVPGPGIRE
jgi:hypothetical protein